MVDLRIRCLFTQRAQRGSVVFLTYIHHRIKERHVLPYMNLLSHLHWFLEVPPLLLSWFRGSHFIIKQSPRHTSVKIDKKTQTCLTTRLVGSWFWNIHWDYTIIWRPIIINHNHISIKDWWSEIINRIISVALKSF